MAPPSYSKYILKGPFNNAICLSRVFYSLHSQVMTKLMCKNVRSVLEVSEVLHFVDVDLKPCRRVAGSPSPGDTNWTLIV